MSKTLVLPAHNGLNGIEHLHDSLRRNYCVLCDFYTDSTACVRKACDKVEKNQQINMNIILNLPSYHEMRQNLPQCAFKAKKWKYFTFCLYTGLEHVNEESHPSAAFVTATFSLWIKMELISAVGHIDTRLTMSQQAFSETKGCLHLI